jgi:peptidyl-prolyl cis-trans isomerase B (cyclophilin B)
MGCRLSATRWQGESVAKKNSTGGADQRLRVYQARQAVHETQVKRRRRDQYTGVAGAVGAVVIASLAFWGWSVGPGSVDAESDDQAELLDEISDALEDESPDSIDTGVPDISLSEFRLWEGSIDIDGITIDLELNGLLAPQAVANFVTLAADGFFDDSRCHRLTTAAIFVLQCGDPEGTGRGGPDYRFGPVENAPVDGLYPAGTLAMARVGGDGFSMGSQFFIVYEDSVIPPDQAGGYTVFGRVTRGLDELVSGVIDQGVVDDAADGQPNAEAKISRITIR